MKSITQTSSIFVWKCQVIVHSENYFGFGVDELSKLVDERSPGYVLPLSLTTNF